MKFEHFGINVPDARASGTWYVEHLGFKIVRSKDEGSFMRFIADETGRVVVELYTNPTAIIPDYAGQHPLTFHIAVWSSDAHADCTRLEKAGAATFSKETLPDGSRLIMMRDPWGVPLQLCQRANPFPGF